MNNKEELKKQINDFIDSCDDLQVESAGKEMREVFISNDKSYSIVEFNLTLVGKELYKKNNFNVFEPWKLVENEE